MSNFNTLNFMKTENQTIVKLSVNELVNVLKQVEKSTFINVTMDTEPKMNKTNNPFYDKESKKFSVRKVTNCNYLIGNDYETRVESNMEKEGVDGTFEAFKPSGKTHVSKCVLVDDKTQSVHYLMVERFDEVKPKVEYLKNGEPMNETDLRLLNDFLVKSSESSRQEQDRKVMVITPKIENIRELSLNGIHYVVE